MDEKPISVSENDESEFGDEKTYVMDIRKEELFDQQGEMNKLLKKTKKSRRRKGSEIL